MTGDMMHASVATAGWPSEDRRDALAEAQVAADIDGSAPIETIAETQLELVDLRALRQRLHLSQAQFAERYGFATASVSNWEQGRRLPDRSTRLLLQLIEAQPDLVARYARGG